VLILYIGCVALEEEFDCRNFDEEAENISTLAQ